MPYFVTQPDVLAAADFARLKEKVLSSPLVSESTLLGSFKASRGFAVTFTREGLGQVEHRFGFLKPFLAIALRPQSGKPLWPWTRRLRWREPNAFYLNVLVVPPGASVGRHTDVTLRGPAGVAEALPQQVTVIYAHVPKELAGGALRLHEKEKPVGQIAPVENLLVRFRGDLSHEVETVQLPEGLLRASVVLEQYRLPGDGVARLPAFHIRSKAGFDAYLRDERPASGLKLDGL